MRKACSATSRTWSIYQPCKQVNAVNCRVWHFAALQKLPIREYETEISTAIFTILSYNNERTSAYFSV